MIRKKFQKLLITLSQILVQTCPWHYLHLKQILDSILTFQIYNIQHLIFTWLGYKKESIFQKAFQSKVDRSWQNIPIKALKDKKYSLAPVLAYIVNLSIQNSVFSDLLNVARVEPLHKGVILQIAQTTILFQSSVPFPRFRKRF